METEAKESEPFTKLMRKATREVHNLSDGIINAKLGFAMSNNEIWAEGLIVFYEIFKYLELVLDEKSAHNTALSHLDIPGMRRTTSFEKDLNYYLGENWKENYTPRISVKDYLLHLKKVKESDSILLVAYVYHLYMGLFSGGQILKKKRSLALQLQFSKRDPMEGLAVVDFGNNSIREMAKAMTASMNMMAETLDAETKIKLIEESKMVFVLNNKLVASIEGTNIVVLNKILKFAAVVGIVAVLAIYFRNTMRY